MVLLLIVGKLHSAMNFVVIVKESYHRCNSWLAFPAHVVFYVVVVAKVLPKDFDKKRPFSVASVSIG